jgi:transporter family-2 protein
MWQILLIFVALLAGAATAVQTGVNSQLRLAVDNPLQAGLISFAVGTFTLAVVALPQGTRWNFAEFANFPWWVWTGGLLGAFFVVSAILLVPRFGAATYLALNLTGQMAAALVLDHFGWLGFPEHRISPPRIIGAILLITGVILIRRF